MLKTLTLVILQLLLVSFVWTGCAKYATTGKMMEKLENRAHMGISEEEFIKRVPTAQLIGEEGNTKVYLVAVGEPCFGCGSADAFVRSFEIYATKFIFEDGSLVAVDRIVSGK
jgi:hypothetical protein